MSGNLFTLPDMLSKDCWQEGVTVYEHVGDRISERYMLAFSQPALVIGLTGARQLSGPSSSELAGPGSVVLHPQGRVVSVAVDEAPKSFSCLMFFVPAALVARVVTQFAGDGPTANGSQRMAGHSARVLSLAQRVAGDLSAYGPAPVSLNLTRLEELVQLAVLEGWAPQLRAWAGQSAEPPAIRLTRIMEVHWRDRLTLPELAFLCGMSLAAFKRAFRRYFGMPPGQWLLERRMAHAAHLLGVEKRRPSEVWETLGFSSHSVFAQTFRRHYKVTPAQYQDTTSDDRKRADRDRTERAS